MTIDRELDSAIDAPLEPCDPHAEAGLQPLLPPNISPESIVGRSMHANRIDKHEGPKSQVAAKLRRMGLRVREMRGANSYDLLVNDQIRVTLRVAYPGMRRHRVTVGGRSYRYRYETWHFNFHHHGRLGERYTDFFICIATDPKRNGKDQIFVIPWKQVTGKTFSLHCGRNRYRGRYAPYVDAWEAIAESAGARPKDLLHVA